MLFSEMIFLDRSDLADLYFGAVGNRHPSGANLVDLTIDIFYLGGAVGGSEVVIEYQSRTSDDV